MSLMISSFITFRLKRLSALSRLSPSCKWISANGTHLGLVSDRTLKRNSFMGEPCYGHPAMNRKLRMLSRFRWYYHGAILPLGRRRGEDRLGGSPIAGKSPCLKPTNGVRKSGVVRDVTGDPVPWAPAINAGDYLTLATVMVSPFMEPVMVTCLPAKGVTFAWSSSL